MEPAAETVDEPSSIFHGTRRTTYDEHGPSTPWGVAYDRYRFADGIDFYTTGGHGGFHLSTERQKAMPTPLKADSEGHQQELINGGWYEEDCEWARVVVGFPEVFDEEWRRKAEKCLEEWHPKVLDSLFWWKLGQVSVKKE